MRINKLLKYSLIALLTSNTLVTSAYAEPMLDDNSTLSDIYKLDYLTLKNNDLERLLKQHQEALENVENSKLHKFEKLLRISKEINTKAGELNECLAPLKVAIIESQYNEERRNEDAPRQVCILFMFAVAFERAIQHFIMQALIEFCDKLESNIQAAIKSTQETLDFDY